eukprot:3779262-Prymnesium_polylepis.1
MASPCRRVYALRVVSTLYTAQGCTISSCRARETRPPVQTVVSSAAAGQLCPLVRRQKAIFVQMKMASRFV